jgi:hypothetical protein
MPNINLIPVPPYLPLTPYHHLADQMPIDALTTRIDIVNAQADIDANTLRNSIGTCGSLDNRLNQSINEDGSLKSTAIDNALHDISEHMDGNGFVRMTLNERAKLSLIADEATDFGIKFNTVSGIIAFNQGFLDIEPSNTITWRYENGSIYADNDFPDAVRHLHYYNVNPVPTNLITPDYINYYTTSIASPYKEGSLRIYLNGIRLSSNADVDVPIFNGTVYVPTTYSFNEDTVVVNGMVTTGLFSLSSAINDAITISIDFDVLY